MSDLERWKSSKKSKERSASPFRGFREHSLAKSKARDQSPRCARERAASLVSFKTGNSRGKVSTRPHVSKTKREFQRALSRARSKSHSPPSRERERERDSLFDTTLKPQRKDHNAAVPASTEGSQYCRWTPAFVRRSARSRCSWRLPPTYSPAHTRCRSLRSNSREGFFPFYGSDIWEAILCVLSKCQTRAKVPYGAFHRTLSKIVLKAQTPSVSTVTRVAKITNRNFLKEFRRNFSSNSPRASRVVKGRRPGKSSSSCLTNVSTGRFLLKPRFGKCSRVSKSTLEHV